MSKDDDLIRRGDVLGLTRHEPVLSGVREDRVGMVQVEDGDWINADAIAALPAAAPVGVDALAAQIIDRTIARLQNLHEYAGRPAWDAVLADEIRAALAPAQPAPDEVEVPEEIGILQSTVESLRTEIARLTRIIQGQPAAPSEWNAAIEAAAEWHEERAKDEDALSSKYRSGSNPWFAHVQAAKRHRENAAAILALKRGGA